MAKVKFDAKKLAQQIKKSVVTEAQRTLKKVVKAEIIGQISKGISPVKGEGRFAPYSDSYKRQIKGQIAFFRNKNGKIVVVDTLSSKELSEGRASRSARRQNTKNKRFTREFNSKFKELSKRVRPVNLKLTGEMLSSFFIKNTKNGFLVGFTDKKARWHNQGKGKLPERRLLPTGSREKFNNRINRTIRIELKKIVTTSLDRLRKKR